MVRINKSFIVFCVVCLVVALGVGAIFFTRMSGGEKMVASVGAISNEVGMDYTDISLGGRTFSSAVPQVVIEEDRPQAVALNREIRRVLTDAYEAELSNEGAELISVEPQAAQAKGMLSVLVMANFEVSGAQGYSRYWVFYYDVKRDQRVDFNGYLDAFDLTVEKVQNALYADRIFIERHGYMDDLSTFTVRDVMMVDESLANVYYNDETSMNEYSCVTVSALGEGQ